MATQHTRPLTSAMRQALVTLSIGGRMRARAFPESAIAGLARRGLVRVHQVGRGCGRALTLFAEITEAGRAEAETLLERVA